MAGQGSSSQRILFWFLIVAAAAILLFVIGKYLFPGMIREVVGFIGGLLAVVTGLFLRRRKQ